MKHEPRYMPKYNYNRLRGRIKEKVGNEGDFAKKIGRSHNFLTKVFKGESYFEQRDIDKGARVLEIPDCEIGVFYFVKEVHANETI